MTRRTLEANAVLCAFPGAVLLVRADGLVEAANPAATARFGASLLGCNLSTLCTGDPGSLRTYLVRCSGGTSPLVGRLQLTDRTGWEQRFRCYGSLARPARDGERASILLRLDDPADDRFTELTGRIRELNEEIRKRQRAQAVLQEALQDRELLLRELHHRVKNNVQMLIGLLRVAQRETVNPEANAVLEQVAGKLMAVGLVQQMLYRSESLQTFPSDQLVQALCAAIAQTLSPAVRLAVDAEQVELANDAAVPLALILNELLANAVKHGVREHPDGVVRVSLRKEQGGRIALSVEDPGPGFELDQAGRRTSGLGLVRGLVRQIGGSFAVERTPVTRCIVRFEDRDQSGGPR